MTDETPAKIAEPFKRFAVPIDSVTPHPENPRQGDVGLLSQLLTFHGQWIPIFTQKSTGHIIKGNHTWKAAKALGWDKIAVVPLDVDDVEAKRRMLSDNRASDMATYDKQALLDSLRDLPDLDGTGFELPDLQDLIDDLDPLDLGGAEKPPKDPVVQYQIVFDDADQQAVFYGYLRWLGVQYPEAESQASRIVQHLTDVLPALVEDV